MLNTFNIFLLVTKSFKYLESFCKMIEELIEIFYIGYKQDVDMEDDINCSL